jgi:hypothetical protein
LDDGGAAKVPERQTRSDAPCADIGISEPKWRAMEEDDLPEAGGDAPVIMPHPA